jgi:hypothetical protein
MEVATARALADLTDLGNVRACAPVRAAGHVGDDFIVRQIMLAEANLEHSWER